VSTEGTVEREVKLGVWPGFALPDLRGTFDGAVAGTPQERRLEAVYFDTPGLRLLRRGVTLRFRRGEEPQELWTVKLPVQAPAVGLSRREISVPSGSSSIPLQLEDLVRGWALGDALVPVARLRTVRNRTILRGHNRAPLAEIDDDEVSILQGSRVAARFRELEVELTDGAPPKLLDRVASQLRAAGAQPVDQIPKVVRALGPSALAPWDLAAPKLGTRPTAAELITSGLIASAARLVDHIAIVVLDEDVEGVHQARVGIRRLRSDLWTAQSLLDHDVVRSLRRELRWLMGHFGEVRDLDVLLERLPKDLGLLDQYARGGAEDVLAEAAKDRAAAYEALRGALRTQRCGELLGETARIATAPPFKGRAAQNPAAEVVPKLVKKPLQDLRRDAKKLGPTPDDESLHRLRIDAKRVRYAAELAAPVVGKKARQAARALAQVQDVLGDHHDAIAAALRLRALGPRTGPAGAWAAGLLAGLALARAAEDRDRFQSVWEHAAAPEHWRWAE
jgi:CHAD domain-containing protein